MSCQTMQLDVIVYVWYFLSGLHFRKSPTQDNTQFLIQKTF